MLSLIDKPPVLINNFLHQKMRLLNTYGDCRWYRVDTDGLVCLRGGYAIVDRPYPTQNLRDDLLALGAQQVLTNSPAFEKNKVLLGLSCSGQGSSEASVFDVCRQIADVFDLPFDALYTRTSHNVRHGSGTVYSHKSAAAMVVQGVLEGLCATVQGQGHASELLGFIKSTYSGNLYCLCDPDLVPFYQENGFCVLTTLTEETINQ